MPIRLWTTVTDKNKIMVSHFYYISFSNTSFWRKLNSYCIFKVNIFWSMFFCVVTLCGLVGDSNVSDKQAVAIIVPVLKMETVCFSETLVSTYESTHRHNPGQYRHFRHLENFKSRIIYIFVRCSENGSTSQISFLRSISRCAVW
jgi:hypothetical protein